MNLRIMNLVVVAPSQILNNCMRPEKGQVSESATFPILSTFWSKYTESYKRANTYNSKYKFLRAGRGGDMEEGLGGKN